MKYIDLHIHTTASDGTLSPAQCVEHALERGLAAIAICDHDTLLGCRDAERRGAELGLEVVPGVEISTKYGGSVHILGYYINTENPGLLSRLSEIVHDRDLRGEKMCRLMQGDGIDISYEQMKERFGEVVGRPHFAQVLMEQGVVSTVNEAFRNLISRGQKYYMPRYTINIEDSLELIAFAGGVPVLAHPFQYNKSDEELRELIEHCMEHGLRGIECIYSGYTSQMTEYLSALCREYALIPTGGSDFHGTLKPHIRMACAGGEGKGPIVPYTILEGLKAEKGM